MTSSDDQIEVCSLRLISFLFLSIDLHAITDYFVVVLKVSTMYGTFGSGRFEFLSVYMWLSSNEMMAQQKS